MGVEELKIAMPYCVVVGSGGVGYSVCGFVVCCVFLLLLLFIQ